MKNMTNEIIPYMSVGAVNFSDSRALVREKFGGNYMAGRYEFDNIVELYDFFPDCDVKVTYDENECLGSVEFFKNDVSFLGEGIVATSYLNLRNKLASLDVNLAIEIGGSFTSYKFGIGVGYDEEDDIITSVIVFKKGYYDSV